MRVCVCVFAYACVRMRVCVCVGTYAWVRMRVCVCVGAYAWVRMLVCVCVGAYECVRMRMKSSTRHSATESMDVSVYYMQRRLYFIFLKSLMSVLGAPT